MNLQITTTVQKGLYSEVEKHAMLLTGKSGWNSGWQGHILSDHIHTTCSFISLKIFVFLVGVERRC